MKRYQLCVAVSATILTMYTSFAGTLGKTHFIVGMSPEEYTHYQDVTAAPASVQSANKILFAPDDNIHDALIALIKEETESIKIAMYLFTDKDIARALQDAQKRGVTVECITDPTCLQNKYNKIDELMRNSIPVWVYQTSADKHSLGNAMHHKFIVFGLRKVWTGSLNVTNSAQASNQENIVVLEDEKAARTYSAQFEKVKTRCARLVPQRKNLHLNS